MAVVAVIGAGWTMRAQADDLNYTVQADLPNDQINQKSLLLWFKSDPRPKTKSDVAY